MRALRPVHRECWCGSDAATHTGEFALDEGEVFQLVRCEGCGVFALHQQPSDAVLQQAYSGEYYGSTRRKFIGPVAKMVEWFQGGRARLATRYTPPDGHILDIGCGNGGFLIQMKQRGFHVEGTEWSSESAARVPAADGVAVHVGDLLALSLPDRSFDLVTMWHVFEHVRQPRETLDEIDRILKPGGVLIMSLPNAESVQARMWGVHWFHWDPPRHLYGFGPRSLERLLRSTGFELESAGTFSLEQNPFGFIQSALNALGFQRDRLYAMLKGQDAQQTALVRLVNWASLAFLVVPALVISTLESLLGRGATMTVRAKRVD